MLQQIRHTPFQIRLTERQSLERHINLHLTLTICWLQGFDALNSQPNPDKPGFQMMVDFDFMLKQIPGQYKFAGAGGYYIHAFCGYRKIILSNQK
jgi:hypothetical protein